MSRTLRPAEPADAEAIAAFTTDTWPDQPVDDYLPDVVDEWVTSDDPDERTLVAVVDGSVVALCHATLCTPEEGWIEGIRVHPAHRGDGHATALTAALLSWCRNRGATVARNLVFDWNEAGLGQSRAAGFEPTTACRWCRPAPAAVAVPAAVIDDPATAWRYWTESDARTHLAGLAIDPDESWAVSELTRDRLDAVARDQRVIALAGSTGRAVATRTRIVEREGPGDDKCGDTSEEACAGDPDTEAASDDAGETVVEYGVAAWSTLAACEELLDAIRADAAALDADATRVCIPDTARSLSDAVAAGAPLADDSMLVNSAPLTEWG